MPPENIRDKIKNKPAQERARLKGLEIAKLAKGKRTRKDYDIEIVDIQPIPKGVEVYARAWQNGKQIGFGKDGSVDIERFVIINPPVLVPDPQGDIVRPGKVDEVTGEKSPDRHLREDAEEAILQSLEHTLSVKKQKFSAEKIKKDKVGNTTTTVYPDADPESTTVDGRVFHFNTATTWAGARDATSGTGAGDTDASEYGLAQADINTGKYSVFRFFYLFDTSSIGDADTVNSATLSIYVPGGVSNADTTTAEVVQASPASNTALTTSDFDAVTFTSGSSLALADVRSDAGYEDWVLNATGEGWVDVTGITKLAVIGGRDLNNNAPTGNNGINGPVIFADTSGTTQDPKLVVEHSAPDPTINVNDSITISEDVTVRIAIDINVNDAVSITESVEMFFSLLVLDVSDNVTITEDIQTSLDNFISVSDSITLSESVDLEFVVNINVSDSVTISESVTTFLPFFGVNVSEDVTISEDITSDADLGDISVSDDITISESVTTEAPLANISVSDSISISESVTMAMDLGDISVNDSISITESVTVLPHDPKTGFVQMRSKQQEYPLGMDDDRVL